MAGNAGPEFPPCGLGATGPTALVRCAPAPEPGPVTTTAEPTGPRPDREPDLEHRLVGWVDSGLITAEQAAGIRAAEARLSGEPAPRADHGPPPGSLVGEALGYVGGVLVVVAVVLITARYRDAR